MEEYKSNSNRLKEQQRLEERDKKLEKVVSGKVITKKKSGARKLASEFISEDVHSVKSYVVSDVIIPAAKKLFYDIAVGAADMLFYGGTRSGNRRSTVDHVSYRNYSDHSSRPSRTTSSYNMGFSYDDIILENRGEAEEVLEALFDLLNKYGIVRVADLFELVGTRGPYTANKYGWTSLNSAEVVRVREGYWIKMPKAMPID